MAAQQPVQRELIDRLMSAQVNEAARCSEVGVLRLVADANISSIYGWGFLPFHRGAQQFINAVGAAAFVALSRELAARFGPRLKPVSVLVKQAAESGQFENA